ncbi:MAG: Teichoic-acid-transporting ATPase [Bacteroidetes bacterium]|jgi:lipopolysaccharide transport system ATP-binding protein|nr:Teichoic-acid-transporting ATPase [Bacteroidota bacterium]
MSDIVLSAENISKQYRLGQLGTGTVSHDLNRWWHRMRGKPDPYLKVGDVNDRSKTASGEYVWSLSDISFNVQRGEVLGIIGKNGAGKSTLLKILSQVTAPTTGVIKIKGRIASLLEVGTGFHPDLTGRENVFLNGAILGMTKTEIKRKLDEIVDFSGVARYIDTPVKRYSSGMMVRLGFAVAAHLEPEILIVDEVLAVGDAEFQKKCLGKMKDVSSEGRTVLFVSHNMGVMNNLCSRIILLDKGRVERAGLPGEIISHYLMGGAENRSFGKIPENTPRHSYHKDVLRINFLEMLGANGERRESFMYLEKAIAEIEIESQAELQDVIIMFSLMQEEIGQLTYSASNDPYNKLKVNIRKGSNKFRISIDQNVLPGNYQVGIAILDKGGYPYDYLQHFGRIKIEKFSEQKDMYPWEKNLGLVNTKTKFEQI